MVTDRETVCEVDTVGDREEVREGVRERLALCDTDSGDAVKVTVADVQVAVRVLEMEAVESVGVEVMDMVDVIDAVRVRAGVGDREGLGVAGAERVQLIVGVPVDVGVGVDVGLLVPVP